VIVIGVPVIVRIAVRAAPVFGATANWTLPFPEPEAPCVTVRNVALLVAVHTHVLGVVTEIDAEPPEAENVVVVTPVMIWQPVGPVVEFELLSLQAAAETTRAKAEHMASVRRERWLVIMPKTHCTDHPISCTAVQLLADLQLTRRPGRTNCSG
jgi:hypothetical protein